ncbi:hypothetical protein [Diplocloster hominis]|uniref:hypothetical protein n=1 Tax=Diplocloster hominis TaxID=3079010 RepID=UPI0031BA2B88
MLYEKSRTGSLDPELFRSPTKEYRAAPFWAWNCSLDQELMGRQILKLKEMGMGGFHIHCRVGLDTEYLGEEFFDDVKYCLNEAKREDLLCWLYDEDRWPSGSAGGMVTKDKQYRSRFLVFEPSQLKREDGQRAFMATARAVRSSDRVHLARYRVELDQEGCLESYRMLPGESPDGPQIWDAWLEISGDTPWYNNQAYLNTLDASAVRRFLDLTHEKYEQECGEEFGKAIPAIFTDEPQTGHKEALQDPFERKAVILPFTDDFEETFREQYGISLMEHLPELFWERGDQVSWVRYLYHRHLSERFAQSFCDQIGKWCGAHHIALTGHMMSEWTLYMQTVAVGEVMRPLKYFGLPGIDMLCDRREYSTAKQAQSVAHQFGREGVMSELYGVTGWGFDFRGHKLAGDWQAALGVTVRVPHLCWLSMEGEAKRDYPASIGYQSPWYREYPYIENHFARLNTALTRGEPSVRVGVIHPIESYWLHWGPRSQTAQVRKSLETGFAQVIEWLLFGLIDFDFISESLLAKEKEQPGESRFRMGRMAYDVVIVPGCLTLRRSTLERLSRFAGAGGKVIFLGEPAAYQDARPSPEPSRLAGRCVRIPFFETNLLKELEPYRQVDVDMRAVDGTDPTKLTRFETGVRASNLLCQMRQDGDARWLFLCHGKKPVNEQIAFTEEWSIRVKGQWYPVLYDTLDGSIHPLDAKREQGITCITWYASQHDSLLVRLEPRPVAGAMLVPCYRKPENQKYLPQPMSYRLEEPNVLLFDMAAYAFDDGPWQPEEEILRIDNRFREKLGYPLRMEALAQPWTQSGEAVPEHMLHLRFTIHSETEVPNLRLALERPEEMRITWNAEPVEQKPEGWFVDEHIRTIPLPPLKKGLNTLELHIPFGRKTNVEWCYLLGEFGVQVRGSQSCIIKKPEKICYGDITVQGLPFYAGNLTYEAEIQCGEGNLWVETSQYRGALVQIAVDGRRKGNTAFAPYRLNCGPVEAGRHRIELTCFGNRANAFGPVHNADASETWYGPDIWRTQGCKWCYEYQLEPMGVLTAPKYWVEPMAVQTKGDQNE